MSKKIKNKSLSLVKSVGNVLKNKIINIANEEIDKEISKLGSIISYDPSLLYQLALLVENLTIVKLKSEEKEQLVIDKIILICPEKNNEYEIQELRKYIQFFVSMGWIKKVSSLKKATNEIKSTCSFFLKV